VIAWSVSPIALVKQGADYNVTSICLSAVKPAVTFLMKFYTIPKAWKPLWFFPLFSSIFSPL